MALDLKKFYSTTTPQRVEITIRGVTDEVHMLRLPALQMRRYAADLASDDPSVRARAGIDQLAAALVTPDGKPETTPAELARLDIDVLRPLMDAFLEVNRFRETGDLGNG